MVMQTVRSRSHSVVLPYIVKDLKKLESPPKTRQLLDRQFSSEISDSNIAQRSRLQRSTSTLRRGDTSKGCSTVSILLIFAVVAGTFYLGSSITNEVMKSKVEELENLRDRLMDTQTSLNAQLQRARKRQEEEMRLRESQKLQADSQLEERIASLSKEMDGLKDQLSAERQATYLAKQETDLQLERTREVQANKEKKVEEMEVVIRKMARTQAINDFGPGPHYARFNINILGHGIKTFTVEFASLQEMPVSVNNFLQQISNGLWSDSSFYLKAGHVLLARPTSWDLKRTKRKEFKDLEHIPIPEYNDNYPHVQYTLGLSGQPSGPDFYINMVDNTIPHGPSGHQTNGSAEPCFAKVIIGKETLDLINTLPTKRDDEYLFDRAVQISQVNIVKDLSKIVGGPEYLASVASQKA